MTDLLHKVLELTKANQATHVVEYLQKRGITEETIQSWGIGFLADQRLLVSLDTDLSQLYETKILVPKVHYSPLHQYITFPMYNQYGGLIGFSGRPPLPNDQVKARGLKKYWHSVFEKRRFLFGLDRAIAEARVKGYMIVGEGQFDTITAHQAGVTNVVSTCGTALTSYHVALLARYVDKVYVVFDNDDSGLKAFERLKKQVKQGIELIPTPLPSTTEKEDIDSYIRKFGAPAFLTTVTQSNSSSEMDL